MNHPIVCIRGLMRDQRHWGEFFQSLGRHLPHHDIVPIDVPGNGRRFREKSPLSIQETVKRLRMEITEKKGIKRAHLVGMSMGGMIALEWARQHPQECCSVTMLNSSVGNFSRFYQRLIWKNYPSLIWSLLFSSYAKLEKKILDHTSNLNRDNARLYRTWVEWAKDLPVARMNVVRQLIAAGRYTIDTKPESPILVVSSSADLLVSPQCSQNIAKAWPEVKYIAHDTAGHDIPLDCPEWLSEQLKHWIVQNDR